MKIYVLTITDESCGEFVYAYKSKAGAIKAVQGDLLDRYHFDTDEPYITREELEVKQADAEKNLLSKEIWEDDGGITYCIDAAELKD